jgi:tRNA (mo5U34)-methyltransferase
MADGFWAFEMEKRGAAEVIGIDVYNLADCDFPNNYEREVMSSISSEVKGKGFAYAKRALNSKVRRKVLSVYELTPRIIGTFDFVFASDLLLHLREPLRALEAIWTVTRGEVVIADAIDTELDELGLHSTIRFMVNPDDYAGHFWWRFSTSALEWMIRLARFQDVQMVSQFILPTRIGIPVPKVVFKARGGMEA